MRGNFISGMVDLVHQQEIRQKKHRLDRETKKSEIKYNVMEIGKESGQDENCSKSRKSGEVL